MENIRGWYEQAVRGNKTTIARIRKTSKRNSIYVNLVKQHTAKVAREIEIALSFLSLMED